jgi:hypothetical protein
MKNNVLTIEIFLVYHKNIKKHAVSSMAAVESTSGEEPWKHMMSLLSEAL